MSTRKPYSLISISSVHSTASTQAEEKDGQDQDFVQENSSYQSHRGSHAESWIEQIIDLQEARAQNEMKLLEALAELGARREELQQGLEQNHALRLKFAKAKQRLVAHQKELEELKTEESSARVLISSQEAAKKELENENDRLHAELDALRSPPDLLGKSSSSSGSPLYSRSSSLLRAVQEGRTPQRAPLFLLNPSHITKKQMVLPLSQQRRLSGVSTSLGTTEPCVFPSPHEVVMQSLSRAFSTPTSRDTSPRGHRTPNEGF